MAHAITLDPDLGCRICWVSEMAAIDDESVWLGIPIFCHDEREAFQALPPDAKAAAWTRRRAACAAEAQDRQANPGRRALMLAEASRVEPRRRRGR